MNGIADTPSEDRDGHGRFLPGHGVKSPGNPYLSRWSAYKSALHRACTPERLERVLVRLAELAEGGDVQAARVLLDRVLGRPSTTPAVREMSLEIPQLETPRDCLSAVSAIMQAMVEGRLSSDDAA